MELMTEIARPIEPFPAHSPAYLADPYSYLRDLRKRGRVFVDPGSGLWFLLRYDDVATPA